MIAALLARFALPRWAVELLGVLTLLAGFCGAVLWYGHEKHEQGVTEEKNRRDLLDFERDQQAKAELAKLNEQVSQAKMLLADAQGRVAQLTEEVNDAQAISGRRESALRAGVERERVLIRALGTGPNAAPGQGADAGSGPVDQAGGPTAAILDPAVASDLERVRLSRNTAINAARACVIQYDALKAAIDTAQR